MKKLFLQGTVTLSSNFIDPFQGEEAAYFKHFKAEGSFEALRTTLIFGF